MRPPVREAAPPNRDGRGPARLTVLLLLLLCMPLAAMGDVQAPLLVFVNLVERGQHIVTLTEDGDVLFPAELLAQVGLVNLPSKMLIRNGRVSLRSLSPKLTYTIDERDVALRITARPELLAKQLIPYQQGGQDHEVLRSAQNTLWIDYAAEDTWEPAANANSLTFRTEMGTRLGKWLGTSGFRFNADGHSPTAVRDLSSIILDDPVHARHLTLGDLYATSGPEGSSLLLGGISVAKDFGMTPQVCTYPGPVVSGALDTPSEVTVYVNGFVTARRMLPPGPFEFLDLPVPTGAVTTTLVIKDAYGRETQIEIPSYLSSLALKPGMHDYSYSLGFRREGFGSESFHYGEPAFLGYHRAGLTNILTGGLRLEADLRTVSGGATAAFSIGRLGEMSLGLDLSGGSAGLGYGGTLRYQYSGGAAGVGLLLSSFSPGYVTLAQPDPGRASLFEGSVSAGYSAQWLGSLSASFLYSLSQNLGEAKSLSLSYSRGLSRALQMRVNLRVPFGAEQRLEGEAMLDIVPQKGRLTANANYHYLGRASEVSAQLRMEPPSGVGVGFNLEASYPVGLLGLEDDVPKPPLRLEADLGGKAPWATYTAGYSGDSQSGLVNFGTAGSVCLAGGSIHFSRPIKESFALARVEGIGGVRVKLNGQVVGRTNHKGDLLVPGLAAYSENELAVEPLDLPPGCELTKGRLYYAPPYRGGGVLVFPSTKTRALYGHVYWLEGEKRTPAELAGFSLDVGGVTIESVVGYGGEFYLQDIPAGRYQVRLFQEKKSGTFELEVPPGKEPMTNLGEIDCVPDDTNTPTQ